jgi:undecaprenyl-diphosphatase
VIGVAVLLVAVALMFMIGEDVVEADGIERADAANLELFISHRATWLVDLSRLITQFGSVAVLIPLGIAASAWLWWRGARLAVALAPLVSLAAAGFVVAVTKAWVARVRPPIALHAVIENDASFPSGHSTDSMAFYLTLAIVVAFVVLRRPLLRILVVVSAGAFAVMVALTRLELGVHWPSDVAVGLCLGLATAIAVSGATLVLVRLDPVDEADVPARRAALHRVRRALASPRPGRRGA